MNTLVILNTAAVLCLGLVVYLMVRQLGMLIAHVGPTGARQDSAGPRIGENVANQGFLKFQPILEGKTMCLILFGAQHCGVCNAIKNNDLVSVAKSWINVSRILYVNDEMGDMEVVPSDELPYLQAFNGNALRKSIGIPFVPYAIVIDSHFRVMTKGLVNHSTHVESLLEDAEQKLVGEASKVA